MMAMAHACISVMWSHATITCFVLPLPSTPISPLLLCATTIRLLRYVDDWLSLMPPYIPSFILILSVSLIRALMFLFLLVSYACDW